MSWILLALLLPSRAEQAAPRLTHCSLPQRDGLAEGLAVDVGVLQVPDETHSGLCPGPTGRWSGLANFKWHGVVVLQVGRRCWCPRPPELQPDH